jgi:hypothetical protein
VSYAESVPKELAEHHAAIGQEARQLGKDPATLVPPFIKFRKIQEFLLSKEPLIASALRNRFIEIGLPVYGFEKEENKGSQGLQWRWFIVGCLLLFICFWTRNFGFSLGTPTSPEAPSRVRIGTSVGFCDRLIRWINQAEARGLIPGIAITATSAPSQRLVE